MPDHAHRAAAQSHGFGQRAEIVGHEGDLRHVHGHVGAAPNGDAHVGQGEGLGVVDTVANHCHGLAFALQAAHEVLLVLGKDVAR